jgi:hypothetical protein
MLINMSAVIAFVIGPSAPSAWSLSEVFFDFHPW